MSQIAYKRLAVIRSFPVALVVLNNAPANFPVGCGHDRIHGARCGAPCGGDHFGDVPEDVFVAVRFWDEFVGYWSPKRHPEVMMGASNIAVSICLTGFGDNAMLVSRSWTMTDSERKRMAAYAKAGVPPQKIAVLMNRNYATILRHLKAVGLHGIVPRGRKSSTGGVQRARMVDEFVELLLVLEKENTELRQALMEIHRLANGG